jgi:hypothetical protein
MSDVFTVVAPIFAIIVVGYLCARVGLVSATAERWISRAVFGVAIPTLLFRTMVNVSAPEAAPWGLLGAYFGGVAVCWAVSFAVARWAIRRSFAEAAMTALGSGYSNTVLIGIPLIFSFFGESEAAVPLFIILSVNLPVMMISGTVAAEWALGGGDASAGTLAWQTAWKIALNPVVIGLACGLVYRQTGLAIAAPVQLVIDYIAWIAAPAALFTMGVSLNRFRAAGQAQICAVVLPAKLVLHPLAVAALALFVFDLPQIWTAVAVLFAAAPTGINAFLIASRYDIAVPAISAAITIGTAASVVTITVISWGFGFQAG